VNSLRYDNKNHFTTETVKALSAPFLQPFPWSNFEESKTFERNTFIIQIEYKRQCCRFQSYQFMLCRRMWQRLEPSLQLQFQRCICIITNS
jgi:hypothetical protein